MTFDTAERSVQGSQPREVWAITTPTTVYRYTTCEEDLVIGGNTYTAIPGARSEVSAASISDPPECVLTMPASDVFVQEHAFGMPPQDVSLVITRYQGAAGLTWWRGQISAFVIKGDWATVHSPSQLGEALETSIPSAHVQRQCNHVLYDSRCGIDRTLVANKLVTTVTAVSDDGTVITVASVGALGAKLQSGEVVKSSDSDRRLIINVSGTDLTINAPFRSITIGGAIQLYRGCKHTLTDCILTFSNAVNFGGHPYMPIVNPFSGDIRGNPWG